MASKILLKGEETNMGVTSSANASTFNNATALRVINTHASTTFLVTHVAAVGAGTTVIGSFRMPPGTVEYVEKKPTEALWAANSAVKASPIGFTN